MILDPKAKEAMVQIVAANLPAAKAGLRPGDVILNIDGQPTPTFKEVTETMGKYNTGDMITIGILRDGKPLKLKMDLVSSDQMAPKMNGDQLTHLSEAGGTISKRHNGFPSALTHDTVLQAAQCGGPVVDLDGRAIGLNIARADRTASYAIPAATVRRLVAEMMAAAAYYSSGAGRCPASASLIPFQRSGHGVNKRRHTSRGRKDAAHDDRPRIKAADEIEAELLGRVTNHHGVGECTAEQVFREPHLFIKFGDRSRTATTSDGRGASPASDRRRCAAAGRPESLLRCRCRRLPRCCQSLARPAAAGNSGAAAQSGA